MWYKVKKIYQWSNLVRPRRLPSAYQEVEYIQSTWTQYIETGVAWSMNMTTELKLNSQYIGESAIFWSAWSLNWNFLMFYNNAIRWHSYTAVDVACSLNTDYTIATENGKVTINGTSYTNTASSSVSTNNVKLFECATWPMWQFKLYYFKIRKGWTLVRDFVPCYRKSDNVIWMYDLVNKQFYTNSWSWTFTKWPNV